MFQPEVEVVTPYVGENDRKIRLSCGREGEVVLTPEEAKASARKLNKAAGHDELLEFLSFFHFIYPNLNDTFDYAMADTEKIALEVEIPPYQEDQLTNGEMLVELWRRFGFSGVVAFCASIRGYEPRIPDLRTYEFYDAKVYIEEKGWSYEPD